MRLPASLGLLATTMLCGTGSAFAGMSGRVRRIQTGYVRSYALSVLLGAALAWGGLRLLRPLLAGALPSTEQQVRTP